MVPLESLSSVNALLKQSLKENDFSLTPSIARDSGYEQQMSSNVKTTVSNRPDGETKKNIIMSNASRGWEKVCVRTKNKHQSSDYKDLRDFPPLISNNRFSTLSSVNVLTSNTELAPKNSGKTHLSRFDQNVSL